MVLGLGDLGFSRKLGDVLAGWLRPAGEER